ncbi:MAG TPA: 50S ribosomal protein L13 [Chloroflexota bacterium]
MKTYTPRAREIRHAWHVIDASGETLGRLAARIATLLRGKHKAYFTPHMDVGDYVVVVNAEKIRVTGKKMQDKVYTRYTGYPGGLRTVTLGKLLAKHPERVIEHAVRGMLPKGPLGRRMFRKLRVYAGPTHPHEAQVRESQAEESSESREREES